MDLKTTQSKN